MANANQALYLLKYKYIILNARNSVNIIAFYTESV